MLKILLKIGEVLLPLIPTVYGGYLLFAAYRIKSYESEEEKEALNKKISRMRRSGNMFFLIGLYLMYQFYKLNFA